MSQCPTSTAFEAAPGTQDWRVLATGAAAWFAAPSASSAAALLVALAAAEPLASPVRVETKVRRGGVRVTLRSTAQGLPTSAVAAATRISELAAAAGLDADPSVLADVQLTVDALDPADVVPFWTAALGYEPAGEEDLLDPLHRNPSIWFQSNGTARPLRNRIHVDTSRAALAREETRREVVEASAWEAMGGPYGLCLADAEGNEIDVVPPGDDWADRSDLADWVLIFGAMTHYPVRSAALAAELVAQAAAIADAAEVELLIDTAPEGVTFDSGKDGWEIDERFAGVAAAVQAAARALGLVADVEPLRFVQLGIDAADIDRVQKFWWAALRYVDDVRRELGVTDLVDPLRCGPPVMFQHLEADEARRTQRNRIHVDLYVPADQAQRRIEAAMAAGGRIVRESEAPFWVTLADPEGNELDIAVITGREEAWGTGS